MSETTTFESNAVCTNGLPRITAVAGETMSRVVVRDVDCAGITEFRFTQGDHESRARGWAWHAAGQLAVQP